jgi:hypothetical protein
MRTLVRENNRVGKRRTLSARERQLPGPVTLGWALLDLLPHDFWMLMALHELLNCLLAPHFLQRPRFLSSMNQW